MSDASAAASMPRKTSDINLDDDGDYFTWTLAERACTAGGGILLDDSKIACVIGASGTGRHAPQPAKNVLHLDQTLEGCG